MHFFWPSYLVQEMLEINLLRLIGEKNTELIRAASSTNIKHAHKMQIHFCIVS